MKYGKYDYLKAKDFLKDAVMVHRFDTPTFAMTTWRKPDGSLWSEFDSRLEYPEDDYRLEPREGD